VARAEANVYDARADLTAAENDLRVARITLLNRMGVDGPRDFELVDTLAAEVVLGTIAGWIREAEENRPELRDLVFQRLAAEEAVRAASADHRPVLSAEGGYGYANEEFPLRKTHIISILFEVPLFTGFLTSERVREAEASLSAARHAETDRRRSVRLEVEQASLSVREASERFEARRKEQEASGENLRLARERYKVGAGDIIEMIDAQVQMTRSETDVIEALYDSSISAVTLLRAVGR
ncbi:MAG TPA: TolC family protein, partial [Candidatus Deferrimicrobiaceae bacterium]|nr:TolC family protein [Candidatus Deferrimicrobiaceae bacterium]